MEIPSNFALEIPSDHHGNSMKWPDKSPLMSIRSPWSLTASDRHLTVAGEDEEGPEGDAEAGDGEAGAEAEARLPLGVGFFSGWWFGCHVFSGWGSGFMNVSDIYKYTGWWFGCHEFYCPINIGLLSSSQWTDSYFSEGVNQPPTSFVVKNPMWAVFKTNAPVVDEVDDEFGDYFLYPLYSDDSNHPRGIPLARKNQPGFNGIRKGFWTLLMHPMENIQQTM